MSKPAFKVFGAGECWRWHLVTSNGAIIAVSPHTYSRRRDCLRAIDTVLVAIFDADIRVMEATK